MGVTAALYAWGFKYENRRPAPTRWKARSTRRTRSPALEFYKELYKCCTPPGYSDAYMQEGLDAFKSGQVAMMMNWFAFWPGMYKDENVGGDKIGFFVNPEREGRRPRRSAGRASRSSPIPTTRKTRSSTSSGSPSPDVQKKWWALGGFPARKSVLLDPGFAASAPFAADFLVAMGQVQDFWQEPAFAELMQAMQKRIARLRRRRPGHGARKRSTS